MKNGSKQIEVYKFGGVAVGTSAAVRTAAAHIGRAAGSLVVVVSAMNGVTDLLLTAARAALRHEEETWRPAAETFRTRHLDLVDELFVTDARAVLLRDEVERLTRQLVSMCESIEILHELTTRVQDAVVARGERLLARIVTEFLALQNVRAAFVDATDVIITENRLGSLWPNFEACEVAAQEQLLPKLNEGNVVIVPGFIGRGVDGEVVTLGRGGSDFSATILARSLDADSVTLFKEVDGLMTADPKAVPNARVLTELHYREAGELAYYGAKVLHPRTMIPLIDRGIPLFVRNTFRELGTATRIAADVKPGEYPVKALTAIHKQALVAIEGSGMMGVPGIAGRAFVALSQAGHSVSMISQASSEASICFVVPESEANDAVRALEGAFGPEQRAGLVDRIHAQPEIALIAVVGLGMHGRPGTAARTFAALSRSRINAVAIAQGSSELNITVAIAEGEATRALLALHSEFQLDKLRPLDDSDGRESKLTLLGFGQIGRALTRQLIAQERHFRDELSVDIRCVAIADRSGVRIEEKGFSSQALARLAEAKASGAKLFEGGSPLTTAQIADEMRKELWLLPSYRPILVDLTSEETAPLLLEALQSGFNLVLANKKPLAVPQEQFDHLLATANERGLALRYEATAGAGLPVLDTLAKLRESGDTIDTILGCFSGTLGYIMTALEDGVAFSQAVRQAWTLGYTEPDPRDDLSGMDVARKALILARTLGKRANIEDIELEPLFSRDVDDAVPEQFVSNLAQLDDAMSERVARARREQKVLRYVAKIGAHGIRVGIEAVPENSPMGRLRGTDNQIAIHSQRYQSNPLVVTGPGAGAEVTAAGVLNDVVAITTAERRLVRW
jgi:aspartokinase/homoserine dehydrogenase 1